MATLVQCDWSWPKLLPVPPWSSRRRNSNNSNRWPTPTSHRCAKCNEPRFCSATTPGSFSALSRTARLSRRIIYKHVDRALAAGVAVALRDRAHGSEPIITPEAKAWAWPWPAPNPRTTGWRPNCGLVRLWPSTSAAPHGPPASLGGGNCEIDDPCDPAGRTRAPAQDQILPGTA